MNAYEQIEAFGLVGDHAEFAIPDDDALRAGAIDAAFDGICSVLADSALALLLRDATAELNAVGRNLMMAVRQMNRMLKGGDPQADTRDHYSRDDFEKLRATVIGLAKNLREAVHRRATQEKKP